MAKIPVDQKKLNAEQKAAVAYGDGPLLIIAGAGTGKTTVVTERIKHLIGSGRAKPQEILALTFTEKASREMEERVDMSLPYGVTQMWISTFHSFCDRVLRAEAINIGLDPGYKLMTEAETILFFRKNLFKFDLHYFRPLGNPTKFIAGMLGHFNRLKDEDVSPEQYLAWVKSQNSELTDQTKEEREEIAKYKELANAYRVYEELKVKEGVVDYADLISNSLKLFRNRKNILKHYQEQFKYILIDEFQDTNFAQNELAILLAGEKQNITVVGDDDQAIYRWRGAAVSNIIQFRQHFPKVKIVVLTKNYRSTTEILNRSYDLIQYNNPDRLEIVEKVDKKLESMRWVNGKKIEIIYADRVENEADAVAKIIKAEVKTNKHSWRDFAILVRANNHADPFVRALMRAGVPYQFLGPGQLFRQGEVKDLIAYLKVLYNLEDNVAMYRVLTMEWLDISPREVASVVSYGRRLGLSLFEACERLGGVVKNNNNFSPTGGNGFVNSRFAPLPSVSPEAAAKIKKLVEMIYRHLGTIKKETAGQILYFFLQDTGLLQKLTLYKSAKEEKIAVNIAKFFDKLKTYEVDHEDAGVFAVVDWIDLSLTLGESPLAADIDWSENDAVNILTVHSAKGLEFPAVFLVNLVSARFPTTQRHEQIPIPEALIKELLPTGDYHLEEERRLFYVGMTRARDSLYFTAAKYYGEGKREKKLSPFIIEAVGEERLKTLESQTSSAKQLSLLEWEKVEAEPGEALHAKPLNYLSYSQVETFKTCPLQYKYRYVLRIPVPPSAALTFGDTMHRTMRDFYELVIAGADPDKNTLLTLYGRNWSSLGFGDKRYEEKMKNQGEKLLEEFWAKGYDPKRVPTNLEQPFKIKITPQLQLGGKIDRVDQLENDKIEIIDYKTGAAPKSRDVASDLQLTVYALAATDKGLYRKPPEKVIVSFYFFEGQEKISATRTQEQLEQVRSEIAQKAKEIASSDFAPTPGKHCDFCEFRLICEAWN